MAKESIFAGIVNSVASLIHCTFRGQQTDVQSALSELEYKSYSNTPVRVGTWVDGRPIMEVRISKENDNTIGSDSSKKRFRFEDLLGGGKTDLILTYMGVKGMFNGSGDWIDMNCMSFELLDGKPFPSFSVKYESDNKMVAFIDIDSGQGSWYSKGRIDLVVQYVPFN